MVDSKERYKIELGVKGLTTHVNEIMAENLYQLFVSREVTTS